MQAVANVDNVISPALSGVSPFDQSGIDQKLIEMDGTPDKSKLGANAILAVSMAVARVASIAQEDADGELWRYLAQGRAVSLPVPMFNILNGGRDRKSVV